LSIHRTEGQSQEISEGSGSFFTGVTGERVLAGLLEIHSYFHGTNPREEAFMKKKSLFLMLVLLAMLVSFVTSQIAWAAERIVQLRTPACVWDDRATTIRFVVSKMPGVTAVEVNPISQMTTVTFDDSKVKVDEIIHAIQMERLEVLGYPKFIK
jgi:copper chaperone CopZ